MNNSEEIKKQLADAKHICRAAIDATGGEGWDFEAVATPAENKQLRYSYENREFYYEVLRTGQENIKADRLESGLPLFDNHPWDKTAMATLGITVSYSFDERGLVVRGKLGARADEALRRDIKDNIIKTVSIEGAILEYNVERKDGMIPVYYATLWEPDSLSFAPVPNDVGAQMSAKRALDEQIKKAVDTKQKEVSLFNEISKKF